MSKEGKLRASSLSLLFRLENDFADEDDDDIEFYVVNWFRPGLNRVKVVLGRLTRNHYEERNGPF